MKMPSRLADWVDVQSRLEQSLPAFLGGQRWFGGKTRAIHTVRIVETIPIPLEQSAACVFLARIDYEDGGTETYALPLVELRDGGIESAAGAGNEPPTLRIRSNHGEERAFCDALWDRAFLNFLLNALSGGDRLEGAFGELIGIPTPALKAIRQSAHRTGEPTLMKAEQSNTSVLYGDWLVLKCFRRIESGVNPDFEIGDFLSRQTDFRQIPPAAGIVEYRPNEGEPSTMGIAQGYVANQGDAWNLTLNSLANYYDRAERREWRVPVEEAGRERMVVAARTLPPALALELLGEYRALARLLGQRTAELHLALASDAQDADFAPIPFSLAYQRTLAQSMSGLASETFGMLRRRIADLPPRFHEMAGAALACENKIIGRFHKFSETELTGLRIRIHGDFHLGQVLFTGNDFVFIDFEGEPARTLRERRAKHSPLRDVAGMLRSFHYAAYVALFRRTELGSERSEREVEPLSTSANSWHRWVSAEFLRQYLETASGVAWLPGDPKEMESFLNLLLLEKAIYELKYELNHRVSWAGIPLEGIRGLIEPFC